MLQQMSNIQLHPKRESPVRGSIQSGFNVSHKYKTTRIEEFCNVKTFVKNVSKFYYFNLSRYEWASLQDLPANIRLGWKWMGATNAPAYNIRLLITAIKVLW
jgi:hypothetical protein